MTSVLGKQFAWLLRFRPPIDVSWPRAPVNTRTKSSVSLMNTFVHVPYATIDPHLTVRRAWAGDMQRVLRFNRSNTLPAWKGLVAPPTASHHACGYVSNALAQGHSLIAEHKTDGWSKGSIRGLALGMAVSPWGGACQWNASMLERWARCIKGVSPDKLMHYTTQFLLTPPSLDKYSLNNILQVILIVPHNSTTHNETVQLLARKTIERVRNVGFHMVRFEATNQTAASALEQIRPNHNWNLACNNLWKAFQQREPKQSADEERNLITEQQTGIGTMLDRNYVAIYTAFAT